MKRYVCLGCFKIRADKKTCCEIGLNEPAAMEPYYGKGETGEMVATGLRQATRSAIKYSDSCDFCTFQESGGHYCLLFGIIIKNMDIKTCADWTNKF